MTTLITFAQEKPGWIYNKPTPGNNSYLYVVESANGTTELEARNQAFARVLQSTAMRLGQPINSDEINKAVQSGKSFEVISSQYNIPINKVCEYTEKSSDGSRVYVLCQVAKAGNIITDFDYNFNGCYDVKGYKNSTALIMSMFIPGAGQMSKRRYGEGIFTLLGEAALATGAFLTYHFAEDVKTDIKAGKNIKSNLNVYNTFKTANYACLSAAGALYVFNLIRAYSAKPRYRKNIAFVPSAVPVGYDMAYGVSLTYNF